MYYQYISCKVEVFRVLQGLVELVHLINGDQQIVDNKVV